MDLTGESTVVTGNRTEGSRGPTAAAAATGAPGAHDEENTTTEADRPLGKLPRPSPSPRTGTTTAATSPPPPSGCVRSCSRSGRHQAGPGGHTATGLLKVLITPWSGGRGRRKASAELGTAPPVP